MTCPHRRHSSHSVSSRQEECHRLAGGVPDGGGDEPRCLHGTSENQQNQSRGCRTEMETVGPRRLAELCTMLLIYMYNFISEFYSIIYTAKIYLHCCFPDGQESVSSRGQVEWSLWCQKSLSVVSVVVSNKSTRCSQRGPIQH